MSQTQTGPTVGPHTTFHYLKDNQDAQINDIKIFVWIKELQTASQAIILLGPYHRPKYQSTATYVKLCMLNSGLPFVHTEKYGTLHTSLATGWTVLESSPGGNYILRTRPDRPWCPPSLLYNEYRVSFPRVKRPEGGVNNPPLTSAEVKERVELYIYSRSGSSWPVLGWILPLHLLYTIHMREKLVKLKIESNSVPFLTSF